MMFSSRVFCSLWGFTWELIPYYSVFLVFSLSFLRTFALLKPLVFIKKRVSQQLLPMQWNFLTLRILVITTLNCKSIRLFSANDHDHFHSLLIDGITTRIILLLFGIFKVVVGLVIGYMMFLVTRQLIGVFLGYSSYQYEKSAGYCWNHISHHKYQVKY